MTTTMRENGMAVQVEVTRRDSRPAEGVSEREADKGERLLNAVDKGAGKSGGGNGGAERMGAAEKVDGVEGRSVDVRSENFSQKELVVNVEIDGEDAITMMDLLKAVAQTCGRVVGCRSKAEKRWELTMSNIRGKERLLDGFKIKNSRVIASEVVRNIRVVSFLNLPLYITDEQIVQKLYQWGVEPASTIRRRKWAGTEVFDGMRFLKVKFTDTVSSLPYSTKFETLEGLEYFRVLHDLQVRVCRLCVQPGHILRECPEFFCFKCRKQGHYARECVDMAVVTTEAGEEEEESSEADEELSEMETEDEERGESDTEAVGGGEERSVGSEEQTEGTSGMETGMPRGRRGAEAEEGGGGSESGRGEGSGRSRSRLRRMESSGESLPCGQQGTSTDTKEDVMVRGQGRELTGEGNVALPQRGKKQRGKKGKKK